MSDPLHLSIVDSGNDPSADEDILLKGDPYELRILANKPNLSKNIVRSLFPKYPQEVMDSGVLVEISHQDSNFITQLFIDHLQAVSNVRLSDQWAKYFMSSEVGLIAAAAANSTLPSDYWRYCQCHYQKEVRQNFSINPMIGYATLAELSGDSDPLVAAIAAGQIQKRFPAVGQPTILQSNDTPSSLSNITNSSSNQIKNTPNGTIQIFIQPLHLVIAGLSIALAIVTTMLVLRSPQQMQQPLNNTVSKSTTEDTNFSLAIEKANEATAFARTSPENKSDWQAITKNWDEAIALLEKISKDDPNFNRAQKKIRTYKTIRSVASSIAEKSK